MGMMIYSVKSKYMVAGNVVEVVEPFVYLGALFSSTWPYVPTRTEADSQLLTKLLTESFFCQCSFCMCISSDRHEDTLFPRTSWKVPFRKVPGRQWLEIDLKALRVFEHTVLWKISEGNHLEACDFEGGRKHVKKIWKPEVHRPRSAKKLLYYTFVTGVKLHCSQQGSKVDIEIKRIVKKYCMVI